MAIASCISIAFSEYRYVGAARPPRVGHAFEAQTGQNIFGTTRLRCPSQDDGVLSDLTLAEVIEAVKDMAETAIELGETLDDASALALVSVSARNQHGTHG